MLAQQLGRRLALAVGGPGAVAELHGRAGGLQPGEDAAQLLALARPRDDVGRQLHQDGAELVAERAGGLHEGVDDRVAQLAAGPADAPALVELGRQLAQRRRQAARLARVPRDDLVGLDVEAEVVGGALGPGRRGLERGERVEGAR